MTIQTLIRSKLHPSISGIYKKFYQTSWISGNRKTVSVLVKLTLKLNEKGLREPIETYFNLSSTVFCSSVGIAASCSTETLQEKAKTCVNGFFDNLKKDPHQGCRYEKCGGSYFMRAWILYRGYSYLTINEWGWVPYEELWRSRKGRGG